MKKKCFIEKLRYHIFYQKTCQYDFNRSFVCVCVTTDKIEKTGITEYEFVRRLTLWNFVKKNLLKYWQLVWSLFCIRGHNQSVGRQEEMIPLKKETPLFFFQGYYWYYTIKMLLNVAPLDLQNYTNGKKEVVITQ